MWKEKLQSLLLKLFGCYKVLESFMKKQGLYWYSMTFLCLTFAKTPSPFPIFQSPFQSSLLSHSFTPFLKISTQPAPPHPLDSGWNFQLLPSKKKKRGWGCKLWSFIAMLMILMWRHRHQMKYILKNKKCWEHRA